MRQQQHRIKAKAKTRTMTLQHIQDTTGQIEIPPNLSTNLFLFSNSETESVHNGVIYWCEHWQMIDTFVMNSYHFQTV